MGMGLAQATERRLNVGVTLRWEKSLFCVCVCVCVGGDKLGSNRGKGWERMFLKSQ